ncbi:MAG: Ubiquinone biosynthesis monooxygenase UbiB [Ktedonobacterales bacterium]|jgi:ubiquinone biosynthesis protein|nr:MAG: Ubiquinone biosynthesis monooxygenase UbiB [Ktedonobacterales bacterium]
MDFDPLVRVLVSVVIITLLGWFAGRLLGIRQSWLRALVASVIGLSAGAVLAFAIAPQNPLPYPVFFLLIILLPSLLTAMGVSALLELLARPGPLVRVESQFAQPPHPIRAIRNWAGRERRYSQITWIAARHGLAAALERGRNTQTIEQPATTSALAHSLRDALAEAGGVFVKLGQVLSTRTDLLPKDVTSELATLQEDVPPAPQKEIESLLTTELDAPPATVFARFETEPVAAASIAQVYRAQLPSGEQVAVKVQRPNIAKLIERDLDILLKLARMLESGTSWGRTYHIMDLANGFAAALREELDFRVEARNLHTAAIALGVSDTVRIPVVYPELSTSRVLVTEWFDGQSIRKAGPLLEEIGAQRIALARELLDALARQIMLSGTFHADPHPGNVFVLRSGQLGLLDFGSVGRIDPLEQAALRDILFAMQRRDVVEMRIALLALAEPTDEMNNEQLERALGRILAQYLAPGAPLQMEMFPNLLRLLQTFGLAFPPEIGAVFRAAVTLEGTLRVLAPNFAIMDEARTLATRWVRESLVPSSLAKSVGDEIQALLPILRRLPRRLDRITEIAERGSLTVKVRLFADTHDEAVITSLSSRAILAFLGAAVGVISVLLLGTSGGPVFAGVITLFQIMGYLGLCASVALIMRVVIAVLRDRQI